MNLSKLNTRDLLTANEFFYTVGRGKAKAKAALRFHFPLCPLLYPPRRTSAKSERPLRTSRAGSRIISRAGD